MTLTDLVTEDAEVTLQRLLFAEEPGTAEASRHYLRGQLDVLAYPQRLLNALESPEAQAHARPDRTNGHDAVRSRFFGSAHWF